QKPSCQEESNDSNRANKGGSRSSGASHTAFAATEGSGLIREGSGHWYQIAALRTLAARPLHLQQRLSLVRTDSKTNLLRGPAPADYAPGVSTCRAVQR